MSFRCAGEKRKPADDERDDLVGHAAVGDHGGVGDGDGQIGRDAEQEGDGGALGASGDRALGADGA